MLFTPGPRMSAMAAVVLIVAASSIGCSRQTEAATSEAAESTQPSPEVTAPPSASVPPPAQLENAAIVPAPASAPEPVAAAVAPPPQTVPKRPTEPTAPVPAQAAPVVVPAGLPAGEARALTQRVCTGCHAVDTLTARGRTADEWAAIIVQMQNMGLNASEDDLIAIHSYLSQSLPPR